MINMSELLHVEGQAFDVSALLQVLRDCFKSEEANPVPDFLNINQLMRGGGCQNDYKGDKVVSEPSRTNFMLEAELIAMHGLQIKSREELLLRRGYSLKPQEITKCLEALKRRLGGEPIVYITGRKEFWAHEFIVSQDVLIPRPESELIVELALKYFPDKTKVKEILDLGTGSGCLILTLLYLFAEAKGTAVDISAAALTIAAANAARLQKEEELVLIQSDWFAKVPNKKFHLIVGNPPYITLEEWEALEYGVKEHEPQIALTDRGDGLKHYRKIALRLAEFLEKDLGVGIFECGYLQAKLVAEIFASHNFRVLEIAKDLAGINRTIVVSI